MRKPRNPSLKGGAFIAILSICGLIANTASARHPFIDACGTVTVNGVPTTNVLITAWFCDGDDTATNDVLATSTLSVDGLPAPYNYHVQWDGPDDGEDPPAGYAIPYYLVFSYGDCNPVIVSCEEIGVLIDQYRGKILLDVDIPCLKDGGDARTPGYWQSKHGKRLIEQHNLLPMLNECCLRNEDGSDADFANFNQFRAWLKKRNAENMAYQLSGHLAAMKLNIAVGYVDSGDMIYAPGCDEGEGDYVSIGSIVDKADEALCEDGTTFAGDDDRDYQECLKDALDAANNNQNWVE